MRHSMVKVLFVLARFNDIFKTNLSFLQKYKRVRNVCPLLTLWSNSFCKDLFKTINDSGFFVALLTFRGKV